MKLKLGPIVIEWNEPAPRVTPSVWIVCGNAEQKHVVRNALGDNPHVVAVAPWPSDLTRISPRTAIVFPGVDLDSDVPGMGRLRDVLMSRLRLRNGSIVTL